MSHKLFWEQKPNIINPPRQHHTAVIWNNYIIIFGGYDGRNHNDILKYDPVNNEIVQYTTSIIPRHAHSCCVYNDYLYIYGGSGEKVFVRINLFTMKTEDLTLNGTVPKPRERHTSLLFGNKMVLYGGITQDDTCIAIDLDTLTSKSLFKNAPKLSYHTAVEYNEKMVIYSGNDSLNGTTKALFIFDFNTNQFQKIQRKDYPMMAGHSAIVWHDDMYIFGGEYFSNELYRINLKTYNITKIIPATESIPSRRYTHTAVLFKDSMFILGGYGDGGTKGDIWEMKLRTSSCTISQILQKGQLFDTIFKFRN